MVAPFWAAGPGRLTELMEPTAPLGGYLIRLGEFVHWSITAMLLAVPPMHVGDCSGRSGRQPRAQFDGSRPRFGNAWPLRAMTKTPAIAQGSARKRIASIMWMSWSCSGTGEDGVRRGAY